ncbi:hypothetical protein Purlil1_13016 [Purpureocillium lilacinum]|uniref:BON domain-containing protein n=1 Tax=Purpureocillium lilacinum TaxID=33203 RepID=A0ABR0BF96_PURLI|nr:hypothetical protein Purlil1_13016 [Purpureocillium lilacinum]
MDCAKQDGSDTWITAKVKSNLLFDKGIPGSDIKVGTSKGRVSLASDVVVSPVQKNQAVCIAQKVKGVELADMRVAKLAWKEVLLNPRKANTASYFVREVRASDIAKSPLDDDEGSSNGIFHNIEGYCGKYMRPNPETAIGEILAWQLLCKEVGNEASQHQATWGEDGQELSYGDVHLRLDEARGCSCPRWSERGASCTTSSCLGPPTCPDSSRRHSRTISAGGRRLVLWETPRQRTGHRPLGAGAGGRHHLRNALLDRSGPEVRWKSKAIALYEAAADSFLTALVSPFHMANGQPLRESELFSITWRNNQRHRSIGLKHGRVMVHVTYHKGQQQTVSIVKTKSTKEDARCFNIAIDDRGEEKEDAEEIDDDVRAMTKQRNHRTRTVNRAYSTQQGASFGGVWDGLVRRGLRASSLWHQFWDLDTVLAPSVHDRKRSCSEAGLPPRGPELVKTITMSTFRRRRAGRRRRKPECG